MPSISEALAIGFALHEQGELARAEKIYRQIVEAEPAHADAWHLLGMTAHQTQRNDEAVRAISRAIELNGNNATYYNHLGAAYAELKQLDRAEECYRHSLALCPADWQTHCNLAALLSKRGKTAEAVEAYRRCLQVQPVCAEAQYRLGNLLRDQGRHADAEACYRAALAARPDDFKAAVNLSVALVRQNKLDDAETSLRRALSIDPSSADAHFRLGALLQSQPARAGDALASFDEAIRLKPDWAEAHYRRGVLHLAGGNFAQGWPDYNWRVRCKDYQGRQLKCPLWDGSALQGRSLLITTERRASDTLQFIRYVHRVAHHGARVFVEVPSHLAALLRTSGYANTIPDDGPMSKFDLHIPLMNLPGLLGTTLETIPASVPYLAADARLLKSWRTFMRRFGGFKVGIVWQDVEQGVADRRRAVPLRQFAPLAAIEGVQLISLQKNATNDTLAGAPARFNVFDLGSSLDRQDGCLMDTAAVMCNLDLVITTDTAAAHLAGGLGVAVWVALGTAPDWRWMQGRTDSPWYPTMRLFRQTRAGQWDDVFREMQLELARRVRQRAGR